MNILKAYKLSFFVGLALSSGVALAQPKTTTDQPISSSADYPGTKSSWVPSKTPDGAYDHVRHDKNMPIPWPYLREADILWKKRVWREIDTREKQNLGFRYQGDENTGGGMFIEILVDGIKRGYITAYSALDGDRFTTELSKEQLMEQLTPKPDTLTFDDPVTGQPVTKIIKKDFKPEDITKFRIKEDWMFDRNEGKMIVRIVGIAPVKDVYGENGDYRGQQAMFWLYYPDIRNTLAKYEVFNPNNEIDRYTWDEFFENRMFSSRIYKVSNSMDQQFSDIFGQDARAKMEALYEGQQAATEIFNKEHDMWVY
jgi:gliding motility associated protien GldN